jgi:hypothetical protein
MVLLVKGQPLRWTELKETWEMADTVMLPRELPGLEQRLQCHSAAAGVGNAVAVVAVVGIAVAAVAQG